MESQGVAPRVSRPRLRLRLARGTHWVGLVLGNGDTRVIQKKKWGFVVGYCGFVRQYKTLTRSYALIFLLWRLWIFIPFPLVRTYRSSK